MKFVTKSIDITHLTLGTLIQYLGKLKIHFLQIFSRYGRKCKQIAF